MVCSDNDTVMLFVGWFIGVFAVTTIWITIGVLCSKFCQKQPVKYFFKYYVKTWPCFLLYMTSLLVAISILIIIGWYVCWDVGDSIRYGILISSMTVNLVFSLPYNIVFQCILKPKLMAKAKQSAVSPEKGEVE